MKGEINMKRIMNMKRIIARIIAIIPALSIQVLWYCLLLGLLSRMAVPITIILAVLSFLFTLFIINKRDEGSYKILWLMTMILLLLLGAVLYLFFGNKSTGRKLKRRIERVRSEVSPKVSGIELSEIAETDRRTAQTLGYISDITGFDVCKNGETEYYPLGENMFEAMKAELEKAQRFIFIEYFIIMDGEFWGAVTDILARKAAQGVDVRVIYDDVGSIATFSKKDVKKLTDAGIKCISFNPLLYISGQLNNRDHRKIMVIDGKIAFSGGINISDEYINKCSRFGHWKDIGFKITGAAVRSHTYMFFEFWNAFAKDKLSPDCLNIEYTNKSENGYVMSYYDNPANEEAASNILYSELLAQSEDYIWFYTPYLILSDTLTEALIHAARRGVDVRIIMPGIPDKKLIFRLSRSYYRPLLEAGVKIYEYSPGFVHAKACVTDDRIACVGTVNLDYRSLFLHYECNSVFYRSSVIADVKRDYEETLAKCRERCLSDMKNSFLHKVLDGVLRIFAPLC